MKMTSQMKHKIQIGTVNIITGLLLTSVVEAAELTSLQWKSSLGEDAVIAAVDEKVQVKTSELDGGKRLRVSFPATDMNPDLNSLQGKGLVKSVEPSKEGNVVHIDLVTSVPAHMSVISVPGGYRISTEPAVSAAPIAKSAPTVIPLAMTSAVSAAETATSEPVKVVRAPEAAASGNMIKQITFGRISGGRVQVNIEMNARPDEPATFVLSLIHISEPTRLGMLSRMPSSA